MPSTIDRKSRPGIHPLHAFLLAGPFPLFLGALLSDIAYFASYQIQWSNFASWLIVGGLVFGTCALLWALSDLFRHDHREMHSILYALLLLAVVVIGVFNALVHARDAWATMPAGLLLSSIVLVLSAAAAWMGFSGIRRGGTE